MKNKEPMLYRDIMIRIFRSKGIPLKTCGDIFNLSPAAVLRIERKMSFEKFKELVESDPQKAAIANAALKIINEEIQSDKDSPLIKVKRLRNEPLKLPTDPEQRRNAIRWMYLKSIAESLGMDYGVKNVTLENTLNFLGDEAPKDVKSLDELLDYLVDQSS